MTIPTRSRIPGLTQLLLLLTLVPVALAGCSSGGGGGSGGSASGNTVTKTADLGSTIRNVPLTSGVPAQIVFTYTIPGDISARGDFTGNLTETLANMSLTASPVVQNEHRFETLWMLAKFLIKDAFAAVEATVTIHISYAGDSNVCSSSKMFGPFSVSGAIGESLSSTTTSVSPTQPSIDIINAGSFEVCIVTTPPIDAYLTINSIAVDFEPCDAPTVDVAGSNWSGTYQCDNFGIGNDSGTVSMSVTQNPDGSYHYVDEGGAEYNGHLCGNTFKFNGGIPGSYTESGTFSFTSDNTATKSSHWDSIPAGISGGDCSDVLGRI